MSRHEGPPQGINPEQFGATRVESTDPIADQIEQVIPQARDYALAIGRFMQEHPWMGKHGFKFDEGTPTAGTIIWERNDGGDLTLFAEGSLRHEGKEDKGDAYTANVTGTFLRNAVPGKDPYVPDGAHVERDSLIGWEKTEKGEGAVLSEDDGTITFATPDHMPTREKETIIYWLKSKPMEYDKTEA